MKTQLINKGKSVSKIFVFVISFIATLFYLRSDSKKGLLFNGSIGNWTLDHWIALSIMFLAILCFVAIIHCIVYNVYDATCPYCQTKSEIMGNAINLKCKACRKISVRKGDWLEPTT